MAVRAEQRAITRAVRSAVGQRDDMVELSATFIQIDSASLTSIVRPLSHFLFNGRWKVSSASLVPMSLALAHHENKDSSSMTSNWGLAPRVHPKMLQMQFLPLNTPLSWPQRPIEQKRAMDDNYRVPSRGSIFSAHSRRRDAILCCECRFRIRYRTSRSPTCPI